MKTVSIFYRRFSLLIALMMSLSVHADDKLAWQTLANQSDALQLRYPAGSIAAEPQAELALQEAQQIQQALQVWAQQAETECYERFFVYACLQDVRQTRRLHADKIHAIILEAKSTQRRLRLQERDQELLQRNTK